MNMLATVRELTQGCHMHAAVFGDIAVRDRIFTLHMYTHLGIRYGKMDTACLLV